MAKKLDYTKVFIPSTRMLNMSLTTNIDTEIATEIVSNIIDRMCLIGPFRKEDAKSTFYVTPLLHRKLDLVCQCTGLTRQEIYTKALSSYLDDKYKNDIDPNLIKVRSL